MLHLVSIAIKIALIIGSLYIVRFVYDKMASNSGNNGRLAFDIKDKTTRWVILGLYAVSCIGSVSPDIGSFRYLVARLIFGIISLVLALAGLKLAMIWLLVEPENEKEFLYPLAGVIACSIIILGVLKIFI